MTENGGMSTTSRSDASQAGYHADLAALCESIALRRPIDPALARRVQERAEHVRAELKQKELQNIAVDLLREVRDE